VTLSALARSANVSVVPTSVVADDLDNRAVVTVSGITDTLGNPVPDGTKVSVTATDIGYFCLADPTNAFCVHSAGGIIANGDPAPDDANFKVFTVVNGRVEIHYDPDGLLLSGEQVSTA